MSGLPGESVPHEGVGGGGNDTADGITRTGEISVDGLATQGVEVVVRDSTLFLHL